MSDLVTFLRARLDEDEAAARKALKVPWATDSGVEVYVGGDWISVAYDWELPEAEKHLARHNPVRVLHEVEAKRRIVDECSTDVSYEEEGMANMILALLALPYDNHPDYDEAWRP